MTLRWLRRRRRSDRSFSRADLLAVIGFAAALLAVAGVTLAFGSGSHHDTDQVRTTPSSAPTTQATTTTLFSQSPTSSTTTTSTTTTTTLPPNLTTPPRSSYGPIVNVVSFDPQCGPYITITARVDAASPVRSVTIAAGPSSVAMANISQGVWQTTVTVPAATQFVIVATDANGAQGTTNGTLYNC